MDSDIAKIVNQLLEKTRASKARWGVSSQSNTYQILLSPAQISIGTYISRLGARFYEFIIKNDNNGEIVERLACQDGTDDGNILKELYTAAKNAYTGKDLILGSIFAKLEQDEIGDDQTVDLPF